MYFVYRFIDKAGSVIYVGKTKSTLHKRFAGHDHLPDECYKMVQKIEYIECPTEADMTIKEVYYINLYRENPVYFNLLDNTALPASVSFSDTWTEYIGELPATFCNSINYKEGYTSKSPPKVSYNKDGSVNQRRANKQAGVSSFVDFFSKEEINLIIEYLINEINNAENVDQERIRFRNLVLFILGINLPLKLNDFLHLKYKDIFDENDTPKAVVFKLGRSYQDEEISFTLQPVVKKVLSAYQKTYNYLYSIDSDAYIFESRKHQVMTLKTVWYILNSAATAVGITKNIGGESLRKTYGNNVYQISENKLNSLVFLEKLWNQVEYSGVIKYLNLTDGDVDYDFYFSERFSLGNVDLSKINCVGRKVSLISKYSPQKEENIEEAAQLLKVPETPDSNPVKKKEFVRGPISLPPITEMLDRYILNPEKKNDSVKETISLLDVTETPDPCFPNSVKKLELNENDKKKAITAEKKIEIVEKYLTQHITMKALAKEYGVTTSTISHWVCDYERFGKSALEDKRRKTK